MTRINDIGIPAHDPFLRAQQPASGDLLRVDRRRFQPRSDLGFLRQFGTFLDLERLDAITIAFDYDDALAEMKRGFGTQRLPRRKMTLQLESR
jgi:hypothetical protein